MSIPPAAAPPIPHPPARFVTGSILHHVVVMAGTGAIGLVAIFAVDLMNLFYVSRLGEQAIAAAVGFAAAINFLLTSVSIGMTIGVSAVVSRLIGADDATRAGRVASAGLLATFVLTALLGIASVLLRSPLLDLLGASGVVKTLASRYVTITALAVPLQAGGMCCAGLLRSVGDARRSMDVTLVGALAIAVLDPLLIFWFRLGLDGAAISTVLSRAVLMALAWRGVTRVHHMLAPLHADTLAGDLREISGIGGPAILTNLATPVAAAYVTHTLAAFGPAAVAGEAMIDRLSPVVFGIVYALTGAVGPIMAQNLGARRYDRVQRTLIDSLYVVLACVGTGWALLALCSGLVVSALAATGLAAELIRLFCNLLAGGFLFTGALFVANASFNNLGHPLLSTLFNWGRTTIGTVPFVLAGARYGPAGVLFGQVIGTALFGISAAVVAFRVTRHLDRGSRIDDGTILPVQPASGRASLASLLTHRRHG